MADTQNIRIGVVKAYFDGIDMGHTKGGVTISIEKNPVKLVVDQFGAAPVDYASNGEMVTVTLRLAETVLRNWKKAVPTGDELGATDARMGVGRNAGFLYSSVAELLVLHPISIADADASEDIVLNKAVCVEDFEVDYTNEDQRIFEMKFTGLVDQTKANGSWIGHIGDSTD